MMDGRRFSRSLSLQTVLHHTDCAALLGSLAALLPAGLNDTEKSPRAQTLEPGTAPL